MDLLFGPYTYLTSHIASLYAHHLLPPASPFLPQALVYTLVHHPITLLIALLHRVLLLLRPPPCTRHPTHPLTIVCISDTHTLPLPSLPSGDLLIHCGDLTNAGTLSDIQSSINQLKPLLRCSSTSTHGYAHIVVIAGNHDSYFDPSSRSHADQAALHAIPDFSSPKNVFGKLTYLQHSSATLSFPAPSSAAPGTQSRTLTLHGSPQIPACSAPGDRFAFEYPRGADAWSNTIPLETDVLVTHTPPAWHLDLNGLGCKALLKECWRIQPRVHVFGHVHADGGTKETVWWDEAQRAFETVKEIAYAGEKGQARRRWMGSELVNVRLWVAGARCVYEGVKGVVWTRLWGGGAGQGGWMVNAALMDWRCMRLGNMPQVVVL